MASRDAHVSPTAHYTSYVWFANGMSHEALVTPLGRALYTGLSALNAGYSLVGRGPNLEQALLARHRVIDHVLEREIEAGRIGQLVEIAAGLSPRGYRLARRWRDQGLVVVEGDLPDMAAHKRRALDDAGLRGDNHHVVTIDALKDEGEDSLAARASELLDPKVGTAIVTEGLLFYFDPDAVAGMWRRFAGVLERFPRRMYLADLFFGGEVNGLALNVFEKLVGTFTRRRVFRHYEGAQDRAIADARAAGFTDAELQSPKELRDVLDLPGIDRGEIVKILVAR